MKKEKIYEYMENNELNIEAVIKDYSNYIQTIIYSKIQINKDDEGKSIYSVNKGEVVDVGNDTTKGKYITIKYDNNVKVVYATCSTILKNVGDKVNTGDVVAKTGNTGRSTGPHLHFEILVNGVQANPEEYLK